jgi:hypothetical protein
MAFSGLASTLPEPPVVKTRTSQQQAELKEWVLGIKRIAKDAVVKADEAQKEAEISQGALAEANSHADTLQTQINEQTVLLNSAIIEKKKAVAHDEATTKENNFLKTILGFQAAAIALLICLWLKVPQLSIPYGIAATVLIPIAVFFAVKHIL